MDEQGSIEGLDESEDRIRVGVLYGTGEEDISVGDSSAPHMNNPAPRTDYRPQPVQSRIDYIRNLDDIDS